MNIVKVGERKEHEIEKLNDLVIEMFEQTEKMLDMSIVLFDENNNEVAVELIEEDRFLDQLQNDIILAVNIFILREQPKARDLRFALSIFAMSYDIERIGDYCRNFAKMMLKMDVEERKQEKLVTSLLNELKGRLGEVKRAFATSSHELAKSIARRDIEIDDLSKKLIKEATFSLGEQTEKQEIKNLTKVILLAKTFERGGDHIVNICEHISYIERGQIYHYS